MAVKHYSPLVIALFNFALILASETFADEQKSSVITNKAVSNLVTYIKSSKDIEQRIVSRDKVVERKTIFVDKLKKRLDKAMNEPDSTAKSRRVSLYAYLLYKAEVRLSAEKLKLWKVKGINNLHTKINTPEEKASLESFLTKLHAEQQDYVQKMTDRSNELSSLITDQLIQKQFKDYVTRIK